MSQGVSSEIVTQSPFLSAADFMCDNVQVSKAIHTSFRLHV